MNRIHGLEPKPAQHLGSRPVFRIQVDHFSDQVQKPENFLSDCLITIAFYLIN